MAPIFNFGCVLLGLLFTLLETVAILDVIGNLNFFRIGHNSNDERIFVV